MAERFQIGLKAFEVSSKALDLSLYVASTAFIYHAPPHDATQITDLNSLLQSKQLWLLPRGLCRLDVHVQLPECTDRGDEPVDFLEFIADIICQSSLWTQLGLAISILDVQYTPGDGNMPNLYFSIEQPDMSSALLSPPHTYTAQFKGLECILRFEASSHSQTNPRGKTEAGLETPLSQSDIVFPTGVPASQFAFDTPDRAGQWVDAAYLVEAALEVTLGLRKRLRGFSIFELDTAPSLLSLAPAIWNSHYLKCVVSHAKNFTVVSNILASSVNGQSPELRRKAAGLLNDKRSEVNNGYTRGTIHSARDLESNLQKRLWDLLQSTLKPTMGARQNMKAITPNVEVSQQHYEMEDAMVDQGEFFQHDLSYEDHSLHEDFLFSSNPTHEDYPTATNDGPGLNCIWYQGDDIIAPESQDEGLDGGFEFDDGMDVFNPQLPQHYSSQYGDWLDEDEIHDCEYINTDAAI